MKKPILLSGIQPSGHFTLGNYVGAMHNWLRLQDEHECYFMVADLHAITVPQNTETFAEHCYRMLAAYLACGIDANQHHLFVQSHIQGHCELAWILSSIASLGELSRMTQFKDKSQQHEQHVNAGLLCYPLLMAADILLYRAERVPVGHDQKQHLELARNLAGRFNHRYGEMFPLPEPDISQVGARVMSLQDPLKKMSKSDPNQQSFITLDDTPKQITKKIKRAVTDSDGVFRYDKDAKPGLANLIDLYRVFSQQSLEAVVTQYQGSGYGTFKTKLAELIVAQLAPAQDTYHRLLGEKEHLQEILARGAAAAHERASNTLSDIKKALGLIPSL